MFKRFRIDDGSGGSTLPPARIVPRATCYAEASEREKAIATGCDEFDAKTIEFESLLATVRHVLAKPK